MVLVSTNRMVVVKMELAMMMTVVVEVVVAKLLEAKAIMAQEIKNDSESQ